MGRGLVASACCVDSVLAFLRFRSRHSLYFSLLRSAFDFDDSWSVAPADALVDFAGAGLVAASFRFLEFEADLTMGVLDGPASLLLFAIPLIEYF